MSNTPRTTLAELHTHSTASDGQYEPEEVARRCAELGVEVWSLTDHDTLLGCERAAAAATTHGIEFIPGVEISARHEVSIHVLGYGLDPTNDELLAFFAERIDLRDNRMQRMVDQAQAAGLDLTMQDVERHSGGGALARPHLARAMVEKGYVASVQHAFNEFLAEGQPLYVPSPHVSVPDAIDLIHRYDGVAILAHPAHYGQDDAIPGWIVEHGLDGIEVAHPRHGTEDVRRYQAIARRYDVLQTRSSDFHGEAVAPKRVLGQTHIEDRWLDRLRERL